MPSPPRWEQCSAQRRASAACLRVCLSPFTHMPAPLSRSLPIWRLMQKAVEALIRAQARLDHARNGAAAKQAARDTAATRCADVDEALQARLFCCRCAKALLLLLPWSISLHAAGLTAGPALLLERNAGLPVRCGCSAAPPINPATLCWRCSLSAPHHPPSLTKQVAKFFAEYWAGVWERREAEAGDAAAALHRCEVRERCGGCGCGCC